jgi:hypothetical protein
LAILTTVAIATLPSLLPGIIAASITKAMATKIVISVLVVCPLGVLLGCWFPTGMRLVNLKEGASTPWYWALNGVFGVLCSALAVLISIYAGISTNFYLAAACYAMLLVCLHRMWNREFGSGSAIVRSSG